MIVLEIAFLTVFWTWVACAVIFLRNTVLPPTPFVVTPEQLGLPAEPVTFTATDGVRLDGWMIPGSPQRPWLIFCHGLGANRADLLPIAEGLHEAGFNLFLFDFRGHGTSAGRTTSFGWVEQRDLEGALTFLGQQPHVPARPYGVYGVSMGGSVSLLVAARDERIGAVAVEGVYTTLEETLGHHLWLMYRLPRVPFLGFINLTYRLRFGVWPARVSPQEAIAALSPRPCLVIEGAQDIRMKRSGEALIAHAKPPKTLWTVPDAAHLEAFSRDPDTYVDRLATFFETL